MTDAEQSTNIKRPVTRSMASDRIDKKSCVWLNQRTRSLSTSCIDLTTEHVYSCDIINQVEVDPTFHSSEHLDFGLNSEHGEFDNDSKVTLNSRTNIESCNDGSELELSELELSKE